MSNWRRLCFSHYLTLTLFQKPSNEPNEPNAGKGTRHFNPLEDYRIFHHWFSGVKTSSCIWVPPTLYFDKPATVYWIFFAIVSIFLLEYTSFVNINIILCTLFLWLYFCIAKFCLAYWFRLLLFRTFFYNDLSNFKCNLNLITTVMMGTDCIFLSIHLWQPTAGQTPITLHWWLKSSERDQP